VLVDQLGQVLLTDFGLAKVVGDSEQSRITKVGTVVGTATYMSPEQAADEPLDGRSDVYSLGVVLFEMLTGRPPFEADTMVAIALKHINEPTPSLREINPGVPPVLEQVVFKAMEKWPEDRYQTASEFGRALQAALTEVDSQQKVLHQPATAGAGAQASTASARINRPRYRQSSAEIESAPPISAQLPQPKPFYRQPGVWVSAAVAAITTIAVIAFLIFWLRPGQITATQLPENSLLLVIPEAERSELVAQLGSSNGRYPRSNYSRQYFEGGMMYWWENPAVELDPIYVIHHAVSADEGNDWSQYKNTWTPDEPTVPDFCPEAAGENGPVMGFGRLWCYNTAVKADMGMAQEPEVAKNDATIEMYSDGIVFSIPMDGQIWVLLSDGSWKTYPMQ
jgi:serine/threonine protein kinase